METPPPFSPNYQTPAATGDPTPLTAEQVIAYQRAHDRGKKIRRAAAVALTDASLMAFFTFIIYLSAIFDNPSRILAVAFTLLTFNSFRGAYRLRKFDPTAPRLLALNQIALALIVILYAVYSLYAATHGKSDLAKQFADAGLDASDITNLEQTLMKFLYLSLIGGTLITQGLMALYYYSREKFIRAYLTETPAWVADLQKRSAAP